MAKDRVPAQPTPQAKREIVKLLEHTLPQFDIDPQRLPARFRRQVIRSVYEYTVLYRADVRAKLQRATPYLPMMKRTLRQHELPTYFAYIPLVESAFRVDAAHPRSGARGLWQLMPLTAQGFGLQVSAQVDERLDPRLATQAAARYLRKLQERFGSKAPLHVLAAYNHGDTNLARKMRRARTRNIWHLYTYRRLPYETRAYLIKMVTWWVVVTHAARFQLVPEPTGPRQRFTESAPPRPLSFAAAVHPTASIRYISTR
jgi:membrane-bound lytic murein transglycosylase D